MTVRTTIPILTDLKISKLLKGKDTILFGFNNTDLEACGLPSLLALAAWPWVSNSSTLASVSSSVK